MNPPRHPDELGAHVSVAGGVQLAPARAAEIGAAVLQLFTKQPNRWADPALEPARADAFRAACAEYRIRVTASHDSYLINLATPDPALFQKSYASFVSELRRCELLGLDVLVTHPGNATDGNIARGLEQNGAAIARALQEVPGNTTVLLETTAGSGRVLGARFEEIATLIDLLPRSQRHRIGVCVDTCHLWAAGYDLVADYDRVFLDFDRIVGLEHIRLFHLNDSLGGLGSRRDRHADIGAGTLGDQPFRRLLRDDRFRSTPKVIETPKGDDSVAADRRNLARLRSYRMRRTAPTLQEMPESE